jgi:hypothetical protein
MTKPESSIGVLQFNPEFYGILLQATVPWGYLSKPHVIVHLFYENFGIGCPSSWLQFC